MDSSIGTGCCFLLLFCVFLLVLCEVVWSPVWTLSLAPKVHVASKGVGATTPSSEKRESGPAKTFALHERLAQAHKRSRARDAVHAATRVTRSFLTPRPSDQRRCPGLKPKQAVGIPRRAPSSNPWCDRWHKDIVLRSPLK